MPRPKAQAETSIAADFLTRCFAPNETIALLLRRENPSSTLQRIVPLERVFSPRYLGWLAHENSTGANVYVAANPLRSGSRKRTKDSIAAVRHLYMDIDAEGEARLARLRTSDSVPPPSIVLSTSPGKYQVLWRVAGFDFELQESTLKLLSIAFGGDRACTDCNRVLRLPGFLNCKYESANRVKVQYASDCTWNPTDFRLDIPASQAGPLGRLAAQPKQPGKHTNSELDWAWTMHKLAEGTDPLKLTRMLASRRYDKPNPLYYAQRTVDIASAKIWLLESIPFSDVVAMLESRRRFEIPSSLCSVRAHEIAQTAQRMIARKKIA